VVEQFQKRIDSPDLGIVTKESYLLFHSKVYLINHCVKMSMNVRPVEISSEALNKRLEITDRLEKLLANDNSWSVQVINSGWRY
jgi:galactose-1-phosphate uridylyltransferase